MTPRQTLADTIAAIEDDNQQEIEAAEPLPDLGPHFPAVVRLLIANPLLVRPARLWLERKNAEMARAQLGCLYSAEELHAMMEDAK